MRKHEIIDIPLDKLELDFNNPRFAELYSGSNNQGDLIDYLLFTEAAEELAKDIADAEEFYPDRPLWVMEQKNGTYLVRDGNRRCAAVKALQFPGQYNLNLKKTVFAELPVVIYKNKRELEKRIRQEHTSSLFREWDRIAKALEIYKMHTSGSSIDSMKDIDSTPSDLIKLASFYYEAVKISGDDLKQLLRRGRGHTGGKTIIFERLFRYRDKCGYVFKNKPKYTISITDQKAFEKYVGALVAYLKASPETNTQAVDKAGESFLDNLKPFGFSALAPVSAQPSPAKPGKGEPEEPPEKPENKKRKSTKKQPAYQRKQMPRPLERLIKECYDLDEINFTNAKTALVRISFECTLKYVIENTEYKPRKKLSTTQYFRPAYYDAKGRKKPTTDFEKMKALFTALILDTGKRKAFENFKLDNPHQIIHNYNVGAVPADAVVLCDNLIPLLEFMLQDQVDVPSSLDLTKL